ncbi:hypothetical protein KC19_11G152400 [Ceratodon purpureus]|uniref:Uncharacterized protein n=1 Tax=Ceratodon purpureus TaxID=3225 RepID=A0A8T0GFB8_CERPU|nr:hypothetical protein KC19_11G152400 [Ceratodon purpureus]
MVFPVAALVQVDFCCMFNLQVRRTKSDDGVRMFTCFQPLGHGSRL